MPRRPPPPSAKGTRFGGPDRGRFTSPATISLARAGGMFATVPGTYALVPWLPLFNPRLGRITPRDVLTLLCKYRNTETGECFPGQRRLARELGITPRSVQRHVDKLVDAGCLLKEERRSRKGTRIGVRYWIFFKSAHPRTAEVATSCVVWDGDKSAEVATSCVAWAGDKSAEDGDKSEPHTTQSVAGVATQSVALTYSSNISEGATAEPVMLLPIPGGKATNRRASTLSGASAAHEARQGQAGAQHRLQPSKPDPERAKWETRLAIWRRGAPWHFTWGSPPGAPNCQVPKDLLLDPPAADPGGSDQTLAEAPRPARARHSRRSKGIRS